MYCNNCGKEMSNEALSCPGCGHPMQLPTAINASTKNKVTVILLCLFFGVLGVHRFYVGKIGTGILQLLTFGGLGIWTLIDFIMAICGKFTDKQGNIISS